MLSQVSACVCLSACVFLREHVGVSESTLFMHVRLDVKEGK